ncbi:hypothetical protein HY498_00320 [Candidatus Woesearchaeota archaeon]|nr:hypothetical protein [Candidatus Woesearchaeota archaeon]
MEIDDIKKVIQEIKAKGPKRNFNQSIDLIINLKNLDVKKTPISSFHPLRHEIEKVKICCFSDEAVKTKVEKIFDKVITKSQLALMGENKKELKKLAREYDYFIAQAEMMPLIASKLGKFLGTRGKMPNPAAGCVFTPNTNFEDLKNKLQKLKRLQTKSETAIKIRVGKENMNDEMVVENIKDIYDYVLTLLPEAKNNVRNVLLKLTMGPIYKFGVGFNLEVPKEKAVKKESLKIKTEKKVKKEPKEKKSKEAKDE